MNYRDYFKGKKITIMGLGLLGRGVGDAAFLARCGARIIVTDAKSAKELASSVARLKKYPNVKFALGGHRLNDFKKCNFVLKAAGVPLNSPFVKEARKSGVPVHMSTALFVKLLPPDVTIIGVTGTRGKTTVTQLIYEITKCYTLNAQRSSKVFLGGNIQGMSTLALLPKVRTGDFVVLELDSWQLQGFGDAKISPHIAVFTNFLPDHLNYYGTMKRYFRDKANIFKYQKKGDYLITCGKTVENWVQGETLRSKRCNLSPTVFQQFFHKCDIKIPGEHNRANITCAVAVADILNIPRAITKKAIENFRGVPGRLELVREIGGVRIYNDTTATTPDATIAALKALGESTKQKINEAKNQRSKKSKKQNIILIMGGADKGLDMSVLAREIPKYCKAVILLPGAGSKKFSIFPPAPMLRLAGNFQFSDKFQIINSKSITHNSLRYIVVKNLKGAFANALKAAITGDIILFSPAFASFWMFKNEYDRGEQFNRLVKRLKSSKS